LVNFILYSISNLNIFDNLYFEANNFGKSDGKKFIISILVRNNTQLIARKGSGVECLLRNIQISFPKIDQSDRKCYSSGSPSSGAHNGAPFPDISGIKGSLPLLGICYGATIFCNISRGEVLPSKSREYGRATFLLLIFKSVAKKHQSKQLKYGCSHE